MTVTDLLIGPVMTEKSNLLSSAGRYVFSVTAGANKFQIRKAVEEAYGVKVKKVWSARKLGKSHRVGTTRKIIKGAQLKKMIVQLKAGEKIEFLEEKKK